MIASRKQHVSTPASRSLKESWVETSAERSQTRATRTVAKDLETQISQISNSSSLTLRSKSISERVPMFLRGIPSSISALVMGPPILKKPQSSSRASKKQLRLILTKSRPTASSINLTKLDWKTQPNTFNLGIKI